MTLIHFVLPDGAKKTVEAKPGTSIMENAVANGIEGIRAECGGSLACATCHVYVDESDWDKVGAANDMEADMLEFAESEVRPQSRLCCQIKVSSDLDGLTVHLPAA